MRASGKLGSILAHSKVSGVEATFIGDLGQAALCVTDVPYVDFCLVANCVKPLRISTRPETYSSTGAAA